MDRRERTNDHLSGVLAALEGWQAGLWTAMPGIVQSFDATAMTAVIQPSIQGVRRHPDGSSELMTMPLLLDCPVMFPNGGGFSLTFPVAAGDEAIVIFASRCIDAWWQSGGVQAPLELRMHDLSDGFAFVGPRSQPRVLGQVSTSATQLRNDAGDVYLQIEPSGKIRIQATDIELHAAHSYSWDVNGFGERVTFLGPNTWNVHTWQTPVLPQIVTSTSSNIHVPEGP